MKGDEALELQQRIVCLEVSRDEFRVDAEAQRAKTEQSCTAKDNQLQQLYLNLPLTCEDCTLKSRVWG